MESQVNIWCDLRLSSPIYPAGVVRVAAHEGHLENTPDIDFNYKKYKGSLIFGSAYICLVYQEMFEHEAYQRFMFEQLHV